VSVSDWEVFLRHASAVLEQCAVPVPDRDEVLAFLTGLQGDVVEGG